MTVTAQRARSAAKRMRGALTAGVDPSSLAVFRIGFGALIAWEVWRAFDTNLIRADYDIPPFLFRWWLFEWVRPLPGPLIYVAFALLGVAAASLALGFKTRISAALTFVGMAYWFLLDKSSYLNHRYLATIVAFLLILMPANAAYSLDARRNSVARTIPAWPVWLVRFQIAVPYFFGGVAKLNFDWLVRAEPLKSALAVHADLPVVGALIENNAVAHVLALGSAALDLFVPFLMLHRRTRIPAFAFSLAFHFINARLFEIGIFPWLMIVGSTVFFEPDWPARMLRALRGGSSRTRTVTVAGAVLGFVIGGFVPETFSIVRALAGSFGVAVLAFHVAGGRDAEAAAPPGDTLRDAPHAARTPRRTVLSRPLAVFLTAWIGVQCVVPLAHFAIPGNEYWTEEGNRFAWHMLVRVKTARVAWHVTDTATGRAWLADPRRFLTSYQLSKLDVPDMILQFAHRLEEIYRANGIDDVQVRVDARARLNGRRWQRYIRREVDLTSVPRPYLPPADWIVPLKPYQDD
jgi:vitamin K-dependent gamma-carboxylase